MRRRVPVRGPGNRSGAGVLARAQAGDADAFRELVGLHRGLIVHACRAVIADVETRCDAEQEATLAIWRGLRSYRGQSKFSTWAYRVAYRAALQVARRRVPDTTQDDTPDLPTGQDVCGQICDRDELRGVLEVLSVDDRTILLLRDHLELSYAEISVRLGIPLGTAKRRVHFARQRFAAIASTGSSVRCAAA